ncbi:MAG: hypothetical protein ABUK16_09220 [Anaerolineales bacterium]
MFKIIKIRTCLILILAALLLLAVPAAVVTGKDVWSTVDLYLRVESELLMPTETGRYYRGIFWTHNDELIDLVLANPNFWNESFNLISTFEMGFEALLNGRGSEVVITAEQIVVAEDYYSLLMEIGSPALQRTLHEEATRFPLQSFIGLTMDESATRVLGPQTIPISTPNPE